MPIVLNNSSSMSSLPGEIWTHIFRVCIMEMKEWRRENLFFLPPAPMITMFFQPGAKTLALVCRSWCDVVLSDSRLKVLQIIGGHLSSDYTQEMEDAIMSHPLCSLHLYLHLKNSNATRFIKFIKSHSNQIQRLSVDSEIPPDMCFDELGNTILPCMEYFHWYNMRDPPSTEELAMDESSLCTFIATNSCGLTFLWLNLLSLNHFHFGFPYKLTVLHLDLRYRHIASSPPSIRQIHFLLNSCPHLERFGLRARLLPVENERELDFVNVNIPHMIAPNLRECVLDANNGMLILNILYYVMMPRLEALQIFHYTSNTPLSSHSLHSARAVVLPILTILSIQPLCASMAGFLRIMKFPFLRDLKVLNEGFGPTLAPDDAIVRCGTLARLHVRGSAIFVNKMLRHLARRPRGILLSLNLDISTTDSEWPNHVFSQVNPTFLQNIRGLTLEEVRPSLPGAELRNAIYTKLPGIETLSLDLSSHPFKATWCNIPSLYEPSCLKHILLPRLKTFKLFPKLPITAGDHPKVSKGQLQVLLDYVRFRAEHNFPIERIICNCPIAPRTANALREYVEEVIDGDDAHHPKYEYPRFFFRDNALQ